jgi:hypothetical protein
MDTVRQKRPVELLHALWAMRRRTTVPCMPPSRRLLSFFPLASLEDTLGSSLLFSFSRAHPRGGVHKYKYRSISQFTDETKSIHEPVALISYLARGFRYFTPGVVCLLAAYKFWNTYRIHRHEKPSTPTPCHAREVCSYSTSVQSFPTTLPDFGPPHHHTADCIPYPKKKNTRLRPDSSHQGYNSNTCMTLAWQALFL